MLRAAAAASYLQRALASGASAGIAALVPILDFLAPPPPPPPAAALSFAGVGGALDSVPAWAVEAALLEQQEAGSGSEEGSGEGGSGADGGSGGGLLGRLLRRSGAPAGGSLLEALTSHLWMAVPKRKTSYSRKRQRQMNPLYARTNLLNFYPCPKCDKGLLKLRHHLCPCDMEKANISGVKKVRRRRQSSSDLCVRARARVAAAPPVGARPARHLFADSASHTPLRTLPFPRPWRHAPRAAGHLQRERRRRQVGLPRGLCAILLWR